MGWCVSSCAFPENGFTISFEVIMLRRNVCALVLFALCGSSRMWPQKAVPVKDPLSTRPTNRIIERIDDERRVVLLGQRHPLATPENSIGNVAPGLPMQRMVLVLRPDASQDAALETLIEAQHDPGSSYYHHWLTPAQFGARFGVSQGDLDQVMNWLHAAGMEVEDIPSSHRTLVFSGTAAQVESAFHTSIQKYLVKGALHYANARDPEIPQALAQVVSGVVALHDFRSVPLYAIAPVAPAAPAFTASNGAHFLMPEDWVTIYDVGPLYGQGLDGTGQSIAVLGRVDVALSDVRTFRSNAGLPPNDPQMIINGPDPGFPWCDDELESAMDVEWAGAIARNATIRFVTSQSTSTDGITLSAQYAVGHNVAPIVSLSYGLCEAALGSGGNAFWNSTWSQAAAQGMTVLVASGDNGAAGCDSPDQTTATQGRGVNGLCSSANSTCVGGTQFNDTYNSGDYWAATNGEGQSSAISYIPELAWNESGWSGGLWAGGGGSSILYSKPAWQAAPGVPADGMRDVPDLALHASIEDAYVVQIQGGIFYASGTSAATPSLASVMALVTEQAGSAQGNANPVFYALATQQLSSGGAAVFHDITSGNNSVPGVTGFNAGVGYDEATGLGSVDASLLVNHWGDHISSNFALSPNVSSVSVAQGSSGTATISLTAQGGFTSPVTLSASGAPTGVTIRFSSATVTANAPVTATITVAANAAAGTSTIALSGTGGGLTRATSVSLTVTTPSFTLTSSASSVTLTVGTPTTLTVSSLASSGFKAAIALSASGLPAGVTASFAPASIASPGTGNSTVTLNGAASAVAGVSTVTLKGTGGGVTKSQAFSLTVIVPSFTLTANSASATITSGSTTTYVLNTSAVNGFKSAIALSVSGLPSGVTAKFAPLSIPAPGNGSSTLTLTTAATAVGGGYSLTVNATGGGVTKTQALSLTVTGPTFTLTLGGANVIVARGGSIPVTLSTAVANGFKSAITLSVSGLPKGVTATLAPTSIPSPGGGSSMLTLKAASSTVTGKTTLTVTATGGGVTKTQTLGVTVQ
jgi:pseudomonalisin